MEKPYSFVETNVEAFHDSDSTSSTRMASPLLQLPSLHKTRRTCFSMKAAVYITFALTVGVILGFYTSPRFPQWTRKYVYVLSETAGSYSDKLWPAQQPWSSESETEPWAPQNMCHDIPDRTLADLRRSKTTTIRVRSLNGSIPSGGHINGPAPVCILVAVPQVPVEDDIYTDLPVPGKGPDTIHLYLNSSDIIVTFPPLRPLPNQPQALLQYSPDAVVYFAEASIFNEGTYLVHGEQEFSNWHWAQEWNMHEGRFTYTTGPDVQVDIIKNYEYTPVSLPLFNFTVSGPRRLPHRPPCDDKTTAATGRWYKYQSFPLLDRELVDEWGYTWQGDQCYLDYFNPAESLDCFADKVIHFYGDSMIRRISKAVLSGGKWCLDPYSRCQDEDDNPELQVPKLDLDEHGGVVIDEIVRESHFQMADVSSIDFGRNTSMYFSFLSSITNSTMNWMDPLYDSADRFDPGPDSYENRHVYEGAQSRPPPEMRKADLVVLGLGAWDQAFTDRFDAFEERLIDFRDAFLHAYPDTPIVMRLSNSWCCRGTHNGLRRYTGGRIQSFDDKVRKVFKVDGATAMDGRIKVFDPVNMNGRPDVIHDYRPSNANHPRASHVRIEMQMLMNSMCQRDEYTGKVSMRAPRR